MSPEKVTEIQIKDLPPKLAEETKAKHQHWFGLLLALLSGLVFTTNNVCFQWLQLSHVHLLFLRGILQSFICLFTALIKRQKIWHGCTVTQLIVILQGTAIGIILLCSYQKPPLFTLRRRHDPLILLSLVYRHFATDCPPRPHQIVQNLLDYNSTILLIGVMMVVAI